MTDSSNYLKMDDHNIFVDLEVFVYRDDDYFISYSPALDLSSFGKTKDEAEKLFYSALDLFMEDIIARDVLADVLSTLGWVRDNIKHTSPKRPVKVPYKADKNRVKWSHPYSNSIPGYSY